MAKKSKKKVDIQSMRGLLVAKKAINQVLKEEDPIVEVDPDMVKIPRPHLPTGSIILDYLIGGTPNRYGVPPCPGLPRGTFSNVYGNESSGKTTFALEVASETIRRGGCAAIIDWEHALDLSYAKALGIPIGDESKFMFAQPNTLESGLAIIQVLALAGVDLIIADSVGAGTPKKFFEQSISEGDKTNEIGLAARIWSGFLSKIAPILKKNESHLLGISQKRDKINFSGLGKKTSEQGGRAWKFWSAVRIDFVKMGGEKGRILNPITNKIEEAQVRSRIKAKIDKTKVSSNQQHEMEFWITFGEGIDNLKSALEICKNHSIIKQSGSWFSWERPDGSMIKEQGESKFVSQLTPELINELTSLAINKIIEVSKSKTEIMDEESEEKIDLKSLLEGNVNLEDIENQIELDATESNSPPPNEIENDSPKIDENELPEIDDDWDDGK